MLKEVLDKKRAATVPPVVFLDKVPSDIAVSQSVTPLPIKVRPPRTHFRSRSVYRGQGSELAARLWAISVFI